MMKHSISPQEIDDLIMRTHGMVMGPEWQSEKDINTLWKLIERVKRYAKQKQIRELQKYIGMHYDAHHIPEEINGEWYAVVWGEPQ